MTKILRRLCDGISAIKPEDINGPNDKVGSNEVIVGQITDIELQKFYAFKNNTIDSYNKMAGEHNEMVDCSTTGDSLTCPKCQNLGRTMVECDFANAVDDLFWADVEATLSPENKVKFSHGGGIGLREGWKIVVMPKKYTFAGITVVSIPR